MCLKGDLEMPELAERGVHRFVAELHLKDRRAAGRTRSHWTTRE
jgi:hypothetical protein